jgi:hypothetical protein
MRRESVCKFIHRRWVKSRADASDTYDFRVHATSKYLILLAIRGEAQHISSVLAHSRHKNTSGAIPELDMPSVIARYHG